MRSVTSERTVNTNRSAKQFARGHRGGIWQGQIWSTEHPTWTTYRSTIYGCPNPTNLNGCHYNHIHFSAY